MVNGTLPTGYKYHANEAGDAVLTWGDPTSDVMFLGVSIDDLMGC